MQSRQLVTISSPQNTLSLKKKKKSEKDQQKCSDVASPAVVKVMDENGFVTQPVLVLPEFRLGLHSPHPTPPRLYYPSVFVANKTSNNPSTVNTPEAYSLTGASDTLYLCCNKKKKCAH